jgi:predicted nucleic acid-binding protein
VTDYEQFFQRRGIQLLPATRNIFLEAARLRAGSPALRTPDALHAATAQMTGCNLFVTNDKGFRQLPDLPLALLDSL